MNIRNLTTLIWGGSIISKGLYTFLWYSQKPIGVSGNSSTTIMVYAVIAAVCLILGILLSKRIENPPKIIDKMINRKRIIGKNNPETNPLAITAISIGLIEVSAIYGLVSFYLGASDQIVLAFIGAAVIGWALAKPRVGEQELK